MIKALAAPGHILELFVPFRRVGTNCVEVSKAVGVLALS